MSYTPPSSDNVGFSWTGAPAYTPPVGSNVAFSWAPTTIVGLVAVPSPLGAPAVVGSAVPEVVGLVSVPSPLGAPALVGQRVIVGRSSVPTPLGTPALVGRTVVLGRVAVPSPLGAPVAVGTVVRYELRGEVRDHGVLINRLVRAYRRDNGALAGEADTVAGRVAIPVGFAAAEYYLIPIDLSPGATDFAPPCSNLVMSELAMDEAA